MVGEQEIPLPPCLPVYGKREQRQSWGLLRPQERRARNDTEWADLHWHVLWAIMAPMTITFKPIGTVHNGITESHHDTPWSEIESRIEIVDEWRAALDGLEQFSHIWVIFNFDRVAYTHETHVHPMRRDWLPLVGLFATRTPYRPNPIGISAVDLLEIKGGTLRVRGLEAWDGTPVLDLKPYLERGDSFAHTRIADWVRQFWATLPPGPR